jgi:hypothetical protein
MLADFISGNREEIVTRYRSKAEIASLRVPLDAVREYTVLAFIESCWPPCATATTEPLCSTETTTLSRGG